jgi:predicted PurR-regulated permease PerM
VSRADTIESIKRTAIFVVIALVPILVWLLFDVVLIATGAILIALLLWLVAEPFEKWLRLHHRIALVLSALIIVFATAGAGYLFGSHTGAELHEVLTRANEALNGIRANLQESEFGRLILSHVQGSNLSLTDLATSLFSISLTFLGGLVVMVFGAIYLAAQAPLYREGLIALFPHAMRPNARETVNDIAAALRLWLLGQLIGMFLVGALATLATMLIGLPSPLALGLIAGFCEFIPFVGPFVGAIPAVLVAITKDFNTVLWTIVAYTVIQQLEGHVISPLLSREMVYIPPLVFVLGIVTITTLFGTVAIVFAAPIAVIVFVAVKKLYIRDSLGDSTEIPGEAEASP